MKGGTQAAVALGVGYVLGRRRKMRLTTLLAAGAVTGGLGSLGGGLLQQGMKRLGSTEALGKMSPQLGDLADAVRGDLIDAGKAAAAAAVANRIESLTDSLHDRAEMLREPGAAATGAAAGAGKAARSGAGEATRRVRRARPSARDEETDELSDDELRGEDDLGDEEEFDTEEPAEPVAEEPEDEEPQDEEPRRPTARRSRTSTTRRRSPVVRAGR